MYLRITEFYDRKNTYHLQNFRIEGIIEKYPTPFHIYDKKAIRENAESLSFSVFVGRLLRNTSSGMKASATPYVMKITKDTVSVQDSAATFPELLLYRESRDYRSRCYCLHPTIRLLMNM